MGSPYWVQAWSLEYVSVTVRRHSLGHRRIEHFLGQLLNARRQYHYAVLRVKGKRSEHQAEQLLVAAMQGNVELLKEMKNIKKGKHSNSELPDVVDGAVGEHNIAELFKQSYDNLFNSAPS